MIAFQDLIIHSGPIIRTFYLASSLHVILRLRLLSALPF